jgi:hypothetical protein
MPEVTNIEPVDGLTDIETDKFCHYLTNTFGCG